MGIGSIGAGGNKVEGPARSEGPKPAGGGRPAPAGGGSGRPGPTGGGGGGTGDRVTLSGENDEPGGGIPNFKSNLEGGPDDKKPVRPDPNDPNWKFRGNRREVDNNGDPNYYRAGSDTAEYPEHKAFKPDPGKYTFDNGTPVEDVDGARVIVRGPADPEPVVILPNGDTYTGKAIGTGDDLGKQGVASTRWSGLYGRPYNGPSW